MRFYSLKRLWLALLLLSVAAGTACAQWSIAASNIVPGSFAGTAGGCIAFKNGTIWAGALNLVGSTDTGKTWYGIHTPTRDEIVDISLLNTDTGAIATWGNLYVTTNGGLTWSSAINNGCHRIMFSIDGKSILACGSAAFYISTDFGVSCGTAYSSPDQMNTFVQGIDSAIYTTVSQMGNGTINTAFLIVSTDNGKTWVPNQGLVDEDSWTIDIDSCNPDRVYVANENYAEREDGLSKIYVSSDRGQTWSVPFSQTTPYLVGSIANSGNALYIETLSDGMIRSEDEGNTWQNIGGPSCYADCRGIAAVNDNIVLALDTSGSIWITTNSGGSPIQSFFSAGPAVLFSGDTVVCDSISRTVQFHRKSCARTWVDAWSIEGIDSLSYKGNNVTPDSMKVVLTALEQGAQNGLLILHINDGSTDTIQLTGFVLSPSDKFQPSVSTLFDFDTAGCDSVMRSIYFTEEGCHNGAVAVASCQIIGPDSDGYHINSISNDSIALTLKGTGTGAQQAQLVIRYSSGLPDTIFLRGFAVSIIDKLQPSASTLFDLDTAGCDSVMRSLYFTEEGCHNGAITVTSCNIIGPDSDGYHINSISNDSIALTLIGTGTGAQQAQLVIRYSSGSPDTIVLSGYVGEVTRPLSFIIPNVSTDTLGGTVAVPISIHGLASADDIDIVLHYDGSVQYLGSFSPPSVGAPSGVRLDIPGDSSLGRSELSITGATSGSVLGYAKFNVFNDSNEAAHATFDSVTVLTQTSTCEYSMPLAATSRITTLSGCAIPMLSQFFHLGKDPLFSIVPNPTNGNVWISSSDDVVAATIEVYNMLGIQQSVITSQISENNPVELLLPERSGVYNIVVRANSGTRTLRVVREN